MKVIIKKSKAEGKVYAPPSKSMAHRALICGAFSDGSVINNIDYSKDVTATIDCLKTMGAKVEKNGNTVKIGGFKPDNIVDGSEVFCNESGSTLRFLIPICLLSGKKITLKGSPRLFERPLGIYEDICRENNFLFKKGYDRVTLCGRLEKGNYTVPGDISSQFITGLLFALSLVKGESTLTVSGKFESASYVDLTLDAMRSFGVSVERKDNVFSIDGGQKYLSQNYTVEGDCSNAAFLDGFNYLGGNVEVMGIREETLQGDRVYSAIFKALKDGKKEFDLSDCPDLAPVVFAVSAYYGGATFNGTARLKIKESDRATVMAEELSKFGIQVRLLDNSVIVEEGTITKPDEMINGHNDHRIVMAMSLLCSLTGGEIYGAEAVSKSYPDYFEVIQKLGVEIEIG